MENFDPVENRLTIAGRGSDYPGGVLSSSGNSIERTPPGALSSSPGTDSASLHLSWIRSVCGPRACKLLLLPPLFLEFGPPPTANSFSRISLREEDTQRPSFFQDVYRAFQLLMEN